MNAAELVGKLLNTKVQDTSGVVLSFSQHSVSVSTPSGIIAVSQGSTSPSVGSTVRIQGGVITAIISSRDALPIFMV